MSVLSGSNAHVFPPDLILPLMSTKTKTTAFAAQKMQLRAPEASSRVHDTEGITG